MKDKIESLLNNCQLQSLYEIQIILESLIARRESEAAALQDEKGRKRRSEARFNFVLRAKVKRITDVSDGQLKEYPATINDISRHGMKLKVDQANYCYSRIIQVNFHSPNGDTKETYLEVVRIKEMFNEKEGWYELGCKCVSNDEVRELQDSEARMATMQNKIRNKTKITIFTVGDKGGFNSQLIARVRLMGYEVYGLFDIKQLLHKKQQMREPQLVIFCPEIKLLQNMEFIENIRLEYRNLALLAITNGVDEYAELLKAGIENCIIMHELDELLPLSIERSILSRKLHENSGSVTSQ